MISIFLSGSKGLDVELTNENRITKNLTLRILRYPFPGLPSSISLWCYRGQQ